MKFRMLFSVVMLVSLGGGCANVVRQYTETQPIVLSPAPPLGEVIAAVNANSQQVHSLHSKDAKIRLPGAPSLSAGIALERDRRFRLKGENALLGPIVDLGSNDELLWLWIRGVQPPATFYCRHDRFAASQVGRQIPVNPEWLIDAFGLTTFRADDRHSGPYPAGDGRLEVRTEIAAAAGRMTKATIIDEQMAWVLEQHLFDAAGQHVASAVTSQHLRDPLSGATLPRRVEIRWPQQELQLEIDLADVQVNYLGDHPAAFWTMPNFEGSTLVDLSDPRLRLPSLTPAVETTVTEPAEPTPASFILRPDRLLKQLLPR